MVFRIHFTVDDLARTWIADAPRPLLEVNLAVRALQEHGRPGRLRAWRRQVLTRLAPQARMVFELVPPRGYTPMFLVPNEAGSLQEQLEQVRLAPRSGIREEMTRFAARERLPGWARGLEDDLPTLRTLAQVLDHVHATAVAPYWSQIEGRFAADRATRAQDFIGGGVERLLARLCPPRIRWVPPVLEVITVSNLEGDLHLGGSGLLLMPTVFGADAPTLDPAGPQPCLTYPAGPFGVAGFGTGAGPTRAHVAALLGTTRAAVLRAVAEHPGCTTKELAAAAGISPSSASEHATVLRGAGLITTMRHRQAAQHSVTSTGVSLLAAPVVDICQREGHV